ncbi:T6SS baseplate protein J-like component [Olavius algarvensis associated proteobacterium Delta 3]|nr:T6SS baseplate protein J-like component [Olavius algarvensis associated proteobacterium Delta 3]
MNQVPDKALLEFLQLLNISPQPAAIARTMVKFSLPAKNDVPVLLPYGNNASPVVISAPGGIDFQTQAELDVLPIECQGYIKQQIDLSSVDTVGEEEVQQLLQAHFNQTEPVPYTAYETFALLPVSQGLLPESTSITHSIDHTLWLALLAPEPLLSAIGDSEFHLQKLRRTLSGKVVSLGIRIDDALCGPQDHYLCPDNDMLEAEASVIWEVATGGFTGNDKHVSEARYLRLNIIDDDDTRGLTRSGTVRLYLPDLVNNQPRIGTWTADQFDPPAEELLGTGQLPPRIDDPKLQKRVLTWIRCHREKEALPQPAIHFIDVNMVAAAHEVTAPQEFISYGNGLTDQVVRLTQTHVIVESLIIQVRVGDRWENWQRVDDLAESRANDPHYELDATTGEVRFGDGIHERIPQPGETIRCLTYKYGGGARGNVAADTLNRYRGKGVTSRLKVTNPIPAEGGRDAETQEQARLRMPKVLRHRERAVARDDFRDLALETPGAHVGRVEILPRHKPHERVDGVPGVVTVIVLPAYDPLHPDQPVPDRMMLRRVCEHLESRRLITTELYVTPPEYVSIWISVAIEAKPDFGFETVRSWVNLAVRQVFAPLPPYGPDGQGWPFGRQIREPDIEAAILGVEGVRLVTDVKLEGTEIAANGKRTRVAHCVQLNIWQLPVVYHVQIVSGNAAEPIQRIDDPDEPAGGQPDPGVPQGPDGPGPAVHVPVDREEC